MPDRNLYDYAFSEIAQRIRMISGVSNVDIYAAPRAVRIKVDMPKLYNLGYTATDLKNALAVSTNMTGVGNLDGPTSQFVLLPDTQLSAAEDYDNIVVGFKDGSPIFFRDIAKAVDTIQYDTLNISFSLGNKKPEGRPIASIAMGIRKRSDGNAITTVADIKKLVEEFKTILPSSVKVSEMYDRSTLIIDNIDDVKETLIIAFLLVVFVIFLFLGRIRDTMIPTVALPFSILLTFIFMYAFGFSVNNLSLMGLTMAIGFLVDDAIVFLENTVRRMEDFGESPATATSVPAREISFTILSMTLSLAAVFIPLVFMSGITGRVFMEFSVTIITAVLMSGLVSLSLTPMMCARILKARTSDAADMTVVERMSHKLEAAFLRFYSPTLRWMLRQNFLTFLVVAACGWGVWFFFGALPQIMFPVGDSGFLQGVFISDTKTSSREIGVLQKRIEDVFYRTPDIKNFVLVSGVSSFINQNMGFGFITLKPRDERRPIAEVSEDLNAQISMIPGLIANFQPEPTLKISTGATSTQQGKYSFALTSMDQNLLYSAAGAFIPKLSARRGDMFSSIQSDMYLDNPQVVLKPFRDKASMLGLSQNNYSNVFKDSYAKLFYYLIKTPFQQYWSIMEASQEYRSFESNLSALNFQSDALLTGGYPVTTLTGGGSEPNPPYSLSNLIPFDSISGTETILAPVTVNHIDNFPSVTVYFDLQPGVAIGDAVNWITKVAADSLPQGVTGQFIGEAVTFKETMMSLVYLIGVAVFVMYVILGILYESYIHPITVLSSLPIASWAASAASGCSIWSYPYTR